MINKKKILGVISIVIIMAGLLTSTSVKAYTPVRSINKLGSCYAYGSTFYTNTVAAATTSHNEYSTKEVIAIGLYYKSSTGSDWGFNYAESAAYTNAAVSASVTLPAEGTHYYESNGEHWVFYSSESWHGYSSMK